MPATMESAILIFKKIKRLLVILVSNVGGSKKDRLKNWKYLMNSQKRKTNNFEIPFLHKLK